MEDRAETPEFVCVCCEGLFFEQSVARATNLEIQRYRPPNSKFKATKICTTCRQHHKDGKMPRMAVINGLEYPELPLD